jgi:transposase
MDVHVRNSYLSVRDGGGQRLKRGRVGNTLAEIAEFLGPFEEEPIRVSLENTTNARAIHGLLSEYGRQAGIDLTAQVLDARKLRVIGESVTKCDRIDADILSELACSQLKLPRCYISDDEEFALREHLRGRSDLVRVQTMLKNRVHAVLHRRGILSPKGNLFTRTGRLWLAEQDLDEAGRSILDRYLALLDAFHATITASNRELRDVAGRSRWKRSVQVLRTMPGVGLLTALTVLAELGDLGRFRSPKALSNYAGIVPVLRESNDKRYQGGITKRGPAHLRTALVEAAWVSIRRVPRYADIYDRIKTRRGAQKAIVAVARHMLEDMFVMLKKNEDFRYASPSQDVGRRAEPAG